MLEARQLTVRYGGRVAVERVGFHLRAGEWLMLVGAERRGQIHASFGAGRVRALRRNGAAGR